MTTTCVIQARMGSSRLPGKVLEPIAGRPMLRFMLDRLNGLKVDHLVVATTDLAIDDPIVRVAHEAGIETVRGSESDVLARFVSALDIFQAEHVVRLTADCPLIDVGLVHDVLATHLESCADYTSNVLPRTFPKGLDVEAMRSEVLRIADHEAVAQAEREHVTPFIYRRPERFRLANHAGPLALGKEWWTVDTREDLEFVRSAVEQLDHFDASWTRILRTVGRRALPARGELELRPATIEDSPFVLSWRNETAAVRWSSTGEPVGVEQHASWFVSQLQNAGKRIFIGLVDGVRVGMVRIEVENGIGVVSIAVDPQSRNKGVGSRLLKELQTELLGDCQVVELHAVIHEANDASLRIFERSGFSAHGKADDSGFCNFVNQRSQWSC